MHTEGIMSDEKKEDRTVNTLEELTDLVDMLIETGRRDVTIHFGMLLLVEEQAYVQLERLAFEHPHTKDAEEVVSYSSDALDEQEYRFIPYKVVRGSAGFKALVHTGCGGWVEPFDTDFPDIGEADEHARGYIDGVLDTHHPKKSEDVQ